MAPITGITVLLKTAEGKSGTDDEIYIGIWGTGGGREFPLSVYGYDDFESGAADKYSLGTIPAGETPGRIPVNGKPGGQNDPARLPIDIASIQYVYLRKDCFRGDDDYQIQRVSVELVSQLNERRTFLLEPPDRLRLGYAYGQQAWLAEIALR